MNPRILGIAGPLQGTVFAVPDGEVLIGREPNNHLWASDPTLSRRHCLLIRNGEEFTIRDLGSRNGTLVNGVPIEEQALRHGDQISIGDSVVVLLLEEGDHPSKMNPVEFSETTEYEGSPLVLPLDDALSGESDPAAPGLPGTARLTRDLNSLLKIATGIGGIRDRESLQWQLLGFLFDVVPAERGAVLLFENAEELSSAVAWDRVRGPDHPVRVSQTILRRVLRERVGLVVSDVASDEALRHVQTIAELNIRSALCVPLVASGRVLGAIYLDTSSLTGRFDSNHLQVMTAVAGIASLALENLRQWEQLRQENEGLRAEINLEHNMVGGSSRMREVFEFIRRVAPTESTVLIQGESGTGKELVARAIHRNSPRAERPFMAINCAAITETLLESELFGHEKGAFTGAVSQKKGKVEAAEGGTLFLDEVTELAPGLQAKLLRVLQEREFDRVGGTRPIRLDVRVIAASNRSLAGAVEGGVFRKDLYYRLNVVTITVPPLRERREDILQLAEHFVSKASRKCRTRIRPISREARECLANYDWPGNVRELENALERALVLGSADEILPDDLPEAILEAGCPAPDSAAKYHSALKDWKKQLILQALQQADGSYTEAAKALGIHPNSLLRLIRNLDIKASVKAAPPR